MNYVVSVLFGLVAAWCIWSFLQPAVKNRVLWLWSSAWLLAIAVAHLHLSRLQTWWAWQTWAVLSVIVGVFVVVSWAIARYLDSRPVAKVAPAARRYVWWAIVVGMAACAGANLYIFFTIGALPLLSKDPERLRFIINQDIFGLVEYVALWPRLLIPAAWWLCLRQWPRQRREWWPYAVVWVCGFAVLLLYTSRATVVTVTGICYGVYLVAMQGQLTWQRLLRATATAVVVIAVFSVAIPAVRHVISFRPLLDERGYSSFGYLWELAQMKTPESWSWITGPYVAPAFNLQALNNAVTVWQPQQPLLWGQVGLMALEPWLSAIGVAVQPFTVPWEAIFQFWWVTATFAITWLVDFGWWGVAAITALWAAVSTAIWMRAQKQPTLGWSLAAGYVMVVLGLSLYTDLTLRPEFLLDVVTIVALGLLAHPNVMRATWHRLWRRSHS